MQSYIINLKKKKKKPTGPKLKEFWNKEKKKKEKEKSLKLSDFSFLLNRPLFLHFFFSSTPRGYTCSGSPILLLLFLSLSLF
jgi:hypothetical protein